MTTWHMIMEVTAIIYKTDFDLELDILNMKNFVTQLWCFDHGFFYKGINSKAKNQSKKRTQKI